MQTSFSGESTYPQVIRDFLESEPLYENGSMPTDETKVATFKTYVAANWISMLDTFELEQPSLNNKGSSLFPVGDHVQIRPGRSIWKLAGGANHWDSLQ